MQHNSYSLSSVRESKEQVSDRKNPLQRIATLINVYHSVDHREASEQDKKNFKRDVAEEISYQLKYVGQGIHGHVKASLKSKDYWESFKERIL